MTYPNTQVDANARLMFARPKQSTGPDQWVWKCIVAPLIRQYHDHPTGLGETYESKESHRPQHNRHNDKHKSKLRLIDKKNLGTK